jgi:hypothetical protein
LDCAIEQGKGGFLCKHMKGKRLIDCIARVHTHSPFRTVRFHPSHKAPLEKVPPSVEGGNGQKEQRRRAVEVEYSTFSAKF